jgi:hypothetical protein
MFSTLLSSAMDAMRKAGKVNANGSLKRVGSCGEESLPQ